MGSPHEIETPRKQATSGKHSGVLQSQHPDIWIVQFRSVEKAAAAVAAFWQAVSPLVSRGLQDSPHDAKLLEEITDRGIDVRTDGGARPGFNRDSGKIELFVPPNIEVSFKAANGPKLNDNALEWLQAQDFKQISDIRT